MYDNSSKIIEVDINEILPNRFQPRIQFDEEEILELSDSIKEHGVIQPLVVRTIGDKYEIIAGERRYKASVLAGKETVPVIVKNLDDKDSAEVALIENVQRKNLTPIEEALSYKKILDMGYITQENLANKLGKSQSSVANKIRLLNLSDEVQEALLENKISERHARSLLRLTTSKEQNEMLNKIISQRLTVRKTDEEIDKLKNLTPSDEENNGGEQNVERKGEFYMNNNMPETTQMPAANPAIPNLDVFGNMQTVSAPTQVQPTMEAMPSPSVTPVGVDIFGSAPAAPIEAVSTPVDVTPAPIEVAPTAPVAPMGGIQFDANGNVIAAPTEAVSTPVEVAPAPIEVAPAAPVAPMGGIQFDANGNVIAAPSETVASPETVAPAPVEVAPSIPDISPIVETPIEEPQMTQQADDLFSFGNITPEPQAESPVSVEATPEVVEPETPAIPEPIIITDYSKQYDPVMPQTAAPAPTVDFKEVISAIRECSSKIEQYGFKIDVEEYDLANLYQVIFKIDKQ